MISKVEILTERIGMRLHSGGRDQQPVSLPMSRASDRHGNVAGLHFYNLLR